MPDKCMEQDAAVYYGVFVYRHKRCVLVLGL